jgi:translocation and assembly module TamB
MGARRIALSAGAAVVLALAITGIAVLLITQTDWGRERVRTLALEQIRAGAEGEVRIGRIEGNLLRRIRLVDVLITDAQGRPFVRADTISTGFSLRGLLRQRLVFANTTFIGAEVVLDKPPDEEWNWVRIFPPDPEPRVERERGWGDWIELRDLELVRSRLTVRTAWEPPDDLPPEKRAEALEKALAGETRDNIVAVAGGYQNVMDFRELHARLPLLLPAHPDSAAIPIEVARFQGIVEPFRPPAATVRDLSGSLRLVRDSLFFSGIRARLPDSRVSADGVYALDKGDLSLRMHGAPVAFADLRWLYPPLPEEGGGRLSMDLLQRTVGTRVVVHDMDLRTGDAAVRGRVDLALGDTVRVRDTDVQFERVHTALIRRVAPDVDPPREGELTGRLRLDGRFGALDVDGDVRFADRDAGTSRVLATGEIGIDDGFSFRGTRIRLEPLQAELVRAFAPAAPLRGTIEGEATLTGSIDDAMRVSADLTLRDPATGNSRVLAEGGLINRDEFRLDGLALQLRPFRLDLLREQLDWIPAGATLSGPVTLDGAPARALRVVGDLALSDPGSGTSRVAVRGGIGFAEEIRLDGMEVRFAPLRTDLLRGLTPDLPAGGALAGVARLDGVPSEMLAVRASLAHTDPAVGVSRVEADGAFGFADGIAFRGLDLRFDPLQVALARAFAPDLPVAGTLRGTARLDGSPDARLAFEIDAEHVEGGERSRVSGGGHWTDGEPARVAARLRLEPLSLATVGRFAPAAGLRGSVSGTAAVHGHLGSLDVDADLRAADGGAVAVRGSLDLESDEPGYDLSLRLDDFDAAAVTARAPGETDLTGVATVRGRGTEPATMTADLRATFVGSEVGDVGADEVRIDASVADGLARFREAHVRLDGAELDATGEFGLTGDRFGSLRFRVDVDSLHAFAAWIPGAEVGVPAPATAAPVDGESDVMDTDPGLPASGIERTGAVTRVRYPGADRPEGPRPVALGEGDVEDPSEPRADLEVAAVDRIPADSIAGSLRAEGTVRGNVERFDLDATAEAEGLVVGGTSAGAARARVAAADVGSTNQNVEIDAISEDVFAGGVGFDRLAIQGRYRGAREGSGSIQLRAERDDRTAARADAEFTLAPDRSEVRLADLDLRVDTVTWRTASPAVIAWGGTGVEIQGLELVDGRGATIRADGLLPVDAPADLQVELVDVELAPFAELVQLEPDVRGRITLGATLRGTRSAPRIEGDLELRDGEIDGREWPTTRARFEYADLGLRADAELFEGTTSLAAVEASIPLDLGLDGERETRLIQGPLVIDVRADSLPLDAVPAFTDAVDDLRGRLRGELAVRGSYDDPQLQGSLAVDLASFGVVPVGIRFREIGGHVSIAGRVATIDSLVAYSGGPIRITGSASLSDIATPVLDLEVEARAAWVIDTEDARLNVDADLAVSGPPDAIRVAGDVRTRQGVIYIPTIDELGAGNVVDLEDPGTYSRVDTLFAAERQALTGRSPLLENLEVDVTVQIDRDVWLRSTEANIEIYTPVEVGPLAIRMNGGPERIAMEGTINTDRGDYDFMSRRFRLTRGALTFDGQPEFNPFLQIAAEHEVRLPAREAFEIRVVIGGTLDDLSIALESTSQPPISQTDLMSYLAFGREASSLLQLQGGGLSGQGEGSGSLVGNVAGLATQQLASIALDELVKDLERDAARGIGLDVIRITPAELPPELFTGSYLDVLRGTEIEAGRYLASRWFVAGQARPTFVRPGARVEYRTPAGYEWVVSWQPRFLPAQPTLEEQNPERTSVFGTFLFREWRF